MKTIVSNAFMFLTICLPDILTISFCVLLLIVLELLKAYCNPSSSEYNLTKCQIESCVADSKGEKVVYKDKY